MRLEWSLCNNTLQAFQQLSLQSFSLKLTALYISSLHFEFLACTCDFFSHFYQPISIETRNSKCAINSQKKLEMCDKRTIRLFHSLLFYIIKINWTRREREKGQLASPSPLPLSLSSTPFLPSPRPVMVTDGERHPWSVSVKNCPKMYISTF